LFGRDQGPLLQEGSLVDPRVRASNEINAPSKLARDLSGVGGLSDLPLRAAFSPAHPLACGAVPLARARALCFPLRTLTSFRSRELPDCPSLRASNEHFLNVRVLRARRAPGHSLSTPLRKHYLISKGSLVDPRVRASNEHIPIVRVPRAGGRLGCPISFPSSQVQKSNARTPSSRRRLGPSRSIRSVHGSHVQVGSAP
jgi:hypothetical protein